MSTPPPHTLPREQRLTSRRAIDALFASGVGGFVYPIRYVILTQEVDPVEASVLVSVPKRNHKRAHVRNLLKRRLREAYRLHKEPLRESCVVTAQGLSVGLLYASKQVEAYGVIEHAIQKIIQTVAQRG